MSTKACKSYGGLQLGNGLCSKSLQLMQILCCCVDFPFVQFRNQYDNDVTIWSPQVIGTPFHGVFKVWSLQYMHAVLKAATGVTACDRVDKLQNCWW